jgi:phosphoribosylformylglycinamidine synthase subunit PurSL
MTKKINEWRVEVAIRKEFVDPMGHLTLVDIEHLGVTDVTDVRVAQVFLISGPVGAREIEKVCKKLLADPVNQDYAYKAPIKSPIGKRPKIVQVFKKPGVMDPVATSTVKGMADMGMTDVSVRSGHKYFIYGKASKAEMQLIADKVLHNNAIEDAFFGNAEIPHSPDAPQYKFKKGEISLLGVSDPRLLELSKDMTLSLNLEEMRTIQGYFADLGRNPTDVELETLAQTWSEHCVHKTLKGKVEMNGKVIDNLLKSTIVKATNELDKDWCVSVFVDDAGIIKFDNNYNLCFKAETHNHPSAIEPYGGAGTGIGGVVRDIMAAGMGSKPIMNTDVFCFGPPDLPRSKVYPGALHPERVMKGVIGGVRDYGNRMGIPTANGAVCFDERYIGNPLVYCGTVGIIPKNKCFKRAHKGDLIVVVGGRTGRDGIHGATFSSIELTEESETVSSGAVQIGNAIEEKRTLDTLLQARDAGLYSCITDCGAGGLSSSVGEMGEELGAEVQLDKIPLKYEGLSYTEVWISEAQERMVIAVPPKNRRKILNLFKAENVEATVIGTFTGDKCLKLRYKKHLVCDLTMDFLHNGVPQLVRKAVWKKQNFLEPTLKPKKSYGKTLKDILGSWNVCSKEWIIRQYDHEVQAGSVLKPLVGVENDGPGDAAVIAPVLGSKKGVAVSNGINPKYGDVDPYAMAASAIDEAVRQIIAVGGKLEPVAILDNFCWGNTDKPDRLGSLVLAAQACYDIAKEYETPFVSGKDSLNNEFRVGDESIPIPPTLLISAIGVIDDVTKCVSMDAKKPGNLVYVVGMTYDELGGSHYYEVNGLIGNTAPQVRAKKAKKSFVKLSNATDKGLVRSCHDCSEGGIAVAAAEMAFAGGFGMDIDVATIPADKKVDRDDVLLFSESNSRFICEVTPENAAAFEKCMKGTPCARIGSIAKAPRFKVTGLGKKLVINEKLAGLKAAWQEPLNF